MVHGITIDGCNPSNWGSPGVYTSLARGNVTAVNATIAIWEGFEATVDATAAWHRRFREEADALLPVRTTRDIVRAHETGRVGIVLGWQNIAPIGNDIERLEAFHVLGVRIVQLAYNVRNLVANGCYEPADEGLSMFGVKAVKKLNELGILVDLSHVGDQSSRHAIEDSDRPVAFTHANLREFCDHPRNKPAALVRALAEKGGVIGANAYPQFLPSGFDAGMAEYLDGLERLLDVAGIDHVGIATDQCEGHDRDFFEYLARLHGTTPHFDVRIPGPNPAIKGLETNAEIPNIAAGLRGRGYGTEEVDKIMGGNWMRLYRDVWGA
ncbi:membrane dipeptidase [Murinocardiopsis flavida]|uniref:Membrane dipeptidase n=2 Tax=Murinocardiopsis flavida TaxID=645275 RepID=A0A2P8DSZ2_9ACTN|nr:membrane dipeptidase [Murinocardiopsis flavida]